MNIDIGSKIKTLRLSKSMTQEQLAKALHVSAQAVSKWENGKSYPAPSLMFRSTNSSKEIWKP